jgi:hypothetical protein
MTTTATGTFEVKMTPESWSESSVGQVDSSLSRFTLDKRYYGDLEGTGEGQMLSAGTVEKGSAGYVALEKVTGKLQGRSGSFILQHSGVMNRGNPELKILVVPDSGTGDLAGLGGSVEIIRSDGKHSYNFAYTLATIQ